MDGDVDVGEGVAVDYGEVGGEVGGDGAELGGFVEEGGGGDGGGLEGLLWRHAGSDEPGEFAGVFAEHGVDGVAAHGDFHAGFLGAACGFEVALDEALEAILEAGGVADLVAVVDVIAVVVDGGDVVGAALDHFVDGGVVHVGGVLERVGAGADGVARTVGAV